MQRAQRCTNIFIYSFVFIIAVSLSGLFSKDGTMSTIDDAADKGSLRSGNLDVRNNDEKDNCEEAENYVKLKALVESLRDEQMILLENEEQWLEEKTYLENKLNEAIKDKLEALESKMSVIIQSKEREEEFIDVMQRIAELEEESSLKTLDLKNKTTEIQKANKEIWNLRLLILESC
ncbi:uncharacterized protein [Lepeophtheirus salmonis]|nr:uncharacterized protein LOC121122762 [Lepeophtheirus salmonis]